MAWKPTKESSILLRESKKMLDEYSSSITLRQLFYLLAAEGHISLDETSYRKIKNLMINARKNEHVSPTTFAPSTETVDQDIYGDPTKYLEHCSQAYRIPRTYKQPNHIEIWVEREPLKVFLDSLVAEYDIPVYVTGGYSSFSFVFESAKRIRDAASRVGSPRILYFSDFSPASINMFESQVSELSNHLNLSKAEMESIMLRTCVEPEHIIKFGLPIIGTSPSTSKTALFESTYSSTLVELGLPPIPLVEIEALNPTDLSEIVSNVLFSLTDQETFSKIAVLEDRNKQEIASILETQKNV